MKTFNIVLAMLFCVFASMANADDYYTLRRNLLIDNMTTVKGTGKGKQPVIITIIPTSVHYTDKENGVVSSEVNIKFQRTIYVRSFQVNGCDTIDLSINPIGTITDMANGFDYKWEKIDNLLLSDLAVRVCVIAMLKEKSN